MARKIHPLVLAIAFISQYALADTSAPAPPCLPAQDESLLPQTALIKELAARTAFLQREAVGSMDGLFIFHASLVNRRIHIDPRRFAISGKKGTNELRSIQALAEAFRSEQPISHSDLEHLRLEEKLLLLSLLSDEDPGRLGLLRDRLGFSQSMDDEINLFRDRETNSVFAQKGEVIIELGRVADRRASELVRKIEERENPELPLSIWNPRMAAWLSAEISGEPVAQAAQLRLDIGAEDQTVLGRLDKTETWHTDLPGKLHIDGIYGIPEVVRDTAFEMERVEIARRNGSILLRDPSERKSPALIEPASYQNTPQKLLEEANQPSSDTPAAADSNLTPDQVRSTVLDSVVRPQTRAVLGKLRDLIREQDLFSHDFEERTAPDLVVAKSQKAAQPTFEYRDSLSYDDTSGLNYSNAASYGSSKLNLTAAHDPVSKADVVSTCMNRSYRSDNATVSSCYEESANPTGSAKKIKLETKDASYRDGNRTISMTAQRDLPTSADAIMTCVEDRYFSGAESLRYCYESNANPDQADQKIRVELASTIGKETVNLQLKGAAEVHRGWTNGVPASLTNSKDGSSLTLGASRFLNVSEFDNASTFYTEVTADQESASSASPSSRDAKIGGHICAKNTDYCFDVTEEHQTTLASPANGLLSPGSTNTFNITFSHSF